MIRKRLPCEGAQCHKVKKERRRINREEPEEKIRFDKLLRELRALRGEKILS
ncbi:MAG: hypothetical protein KBA66_22695 [Leptospiraceae bacterium]|nr:hypothetical protein [Leptospiraceae bacterium]